MSLLKKLFKNENKDCCEASIKEVKESTKSEEQKASCCTVRIEEVKK